MRWTKPGDSLENCVVAEQESFWAGEGAISTLLGATSNETWVLNYPLMSDGVGTPC